MATTTTDIRGLHVRRDGPRGAPVLLLLHGSAASTRSWDALVPYLTGAHHVVRLDLPGHGESAEPEDGKHEISAHGRRAAAVLDRLCVERAVVVWHSTGGYVATALAEQRPGLVDGLVLVNSGPRMEAFIGGEDIPIGPEEWATLTDEQIRHAMAPAFSRPGFEIPQAMVDDVRGMTYASFVGIQQAATDHLVERALPERLVAVGKPLLVVFGEDDRRWRSASAAEYEAVPGARVVLLPGLGHSPIVEDPARTAVPLLDFAARVASSPDCF
ncbi:alpha/beta fold hydrolase [Streptomyces sp. Da 82-17]|uniref:alpha/beta fold hydrolase n=1 Tax=Streptomyces sp. Da 82-17 TaxID=3377116 RepID=UPI0038D4C18D